MKTYCFSFLAVLFIFSISACDAADAPRPRLELHSQKFNGGNPEIWIDIYPNGQPLQDIRIDWGRHSADTQPTLYATSGLNQLESVEFIDIASDNILNVSLLQISSPFRLYAKFGFTDLMEEGEVLHYKVRTTHSAEDDQGDNYILYTWSEQYRIEYESSADGIGNGGGIVLGETCLDPIPTPVITWPLDGDSCVGFVANNQSDEAVVEFLWEEVEGVGNHPQGYQVEVRTAGSDPCINGWEEGVSGYFGALPDCWVTDVNQPIHSEILPTGAAYEWRVRASCLQEDGSLISGTLTLTQTFTTAVTAQCGDQ